MNIVMMGTGPFAVPTFRWLVASEHSVPLLVTRPVPPAKGRRKGAAHPMRDAAEELGIPVFDPDDVNGSEARQRLEQLQPDLLVVCDYGQILSPEALAVATLGGINLHGSLLPKYRGAAPVHWALYHGDADTGVTVIHMTPQLDAGPALVQRSLPIDPDDDAASLEQRLAELGVPAVRDAIQLLATWDGRSEIGVRQDPSLATRAPRLTKEHGRIDWSRSAESIRNQVRALKPWPGSYTQWQRQPGAWERLIVDRVAAVEDPETQGDLLGGGQANPPGTILAADARGLWVATGSCPLALLAVQPAGKRVLDAAEFLRGYRLEVGDRLK